MRSIVAIVLALVVWTACKSSKTAAVEEKTVPLEDKQALPEIDGTWIWVKTQCCGRMQRTTYDTTARPTFVEFNDDNSFYKKRNNEILSQGTYELKFDFNLNMPVLQLSNMNQLAIVHFNNDTLLLDYGYMDLQTEYYIRPKRK